MLVIRRRVGETIVIGRDVEVTVVEISPTRVKLAVGGPRSVTVVRKETSAVASENRRAAEFAGSAGLSEVVRILNRKNTG